MATTLTDKFNTLIKGLTAEIGKAGSSVIDARFKRGRAYFSIRQYSSALIDFRECVKTDPTHKEKDGCCCFYMYIFTLAKLKQYKKALNECTKYKNKVNEAVVFYSEGLVYKEQADTNSALNKFNTAIITDPTFVAPHISIGQIYREEQYTDALAQYNEAEKKANAASLQIDVAIHIGRGYVFRKQNYFKEALENYEKAKATNLYFIDAYIGMGYTYFENSNYPQGKNRLKQVEDQLNQAKSEFEQALELNNEYAAAYTGLGHVYIRQEKYTCAEACFKQATSSEVRNQKIVYAFNGLMIVYREQGLYTNVTAVFKAAKKIDKKFAELYLNQGRSWYHQNKYWDALAEYINALKLDPTNYRIYYHIGRILYATGEKEYSEALVAFETALETYTEWSKGKNPDLEDYYVKIVKVYIDELGKYQKAKSKYTSKVGLSDKDTAFKVIKETNKLVEKIDEHVFEVKDFCSPKNKVTSEEAFIFTVLRRWNSFTPIGKGVLESSKGGGYFIKSETRGIVIDPGFDFITNFLSAGYNFNEITDVLITHAHNDHTTDIDPIMTLLLKHNEILLGGDLSNPSDIKRGSIIDKVLQTFNYNRVWKDLHKNGQELVKKEIEKRYNDVTEKNKITFYITSGILKKFAGFFDLKEKGSKYKVVCVDAETTKPFTIGKVKVQVIKANHYDIVSDKASVGFCFEQEDFVLIYTGDTGFADEKIREQYEEMAKEYKHQNKKIVLIANFGGIKSNERFYLPQSEPKDEKEFYYKTHLGRVGLVKLVETLKPTLCVISEFGEEFKYSRIEFSKIFNEIFQKSKIKFLPADIGLSVKYEGTDIKIKDTTTETETNREYKELSKVKVGEIKILNELHYYSDKQTFEQYVKNRKKNYRQMTKQIKADCE